MKPIERSSCYCQCRIVRDFRFEQFKLINRLALGARFRAFEETAQRRPSGLSPFAFPP
jgi:hypothetical protein